MANPSRVSLTVLENTEIVAPDPPRIPNDDSDLWCEDCGTSVPQNTIVVCKCDCFICSDCEANHGEGVC